MFKSATLLKGLEQLAFPATCLGCGMAMPDRMDVLCEQCLQLRFEDPNPDNDRSCGNIILPDEIDFLDAMWMYDKDGIVQTLMRMLKYEGLDHVGLFLGQVVAGRIAGRHLGGRIPDKTQLVLLPVPIHKKRRKKRGYNQAERIARGIGDVLSVPVAGDEVVSRVRHTATQTRYNFEKRMHNLKNAFELHQPAALEGKHVLIIDDVYTTGSTCFTLSAIIKPASPASIGVVTIGLA